MVVGYISQHLFTSIRFRQYVLEFALYLVVLLLSPRSATTVQDVVIFLDRGHREKGGGNNSQ